MIGHSVTKIANIQDALKPLVMHDPVHHEKLQKEKTRNNCPPFL